MIVRERSELHRVKLYVREHNLDSRRHRCGNVHSARRSRRFLRQLTNKVCLAARMTRHLVALPVHRTATRSLGGRHREIGYTSRHG